MKNSISKIPFIIITFSLLAVTFSNCETTDEETIEDPTVNSFTISTVNTNLKPFDIIEVYTYEKSLSTSELNVSIDGSTLDAYIINDSTFAIMIPKTSSGSIKLIASVDNSEATLDLNIEPLPNIDNPTQIIQSATEDFNTIIGDLQEEASLVQSSLDSETEILLNNLINEFESTLSQLSESEKEDLAHFIQQNEFLFESSSYSDTKTTEDIFSNYDAYFKLQMIKIAGSGIAMGLLLTAPEPTFITKGAAIIAGIYLVKTLKKTGYKLIELYDKEAIPNDSELTSDKSDFIFPDYFTTQLNVSTTYRTLYNIDIDSPSETIKSVINETKIFFEWWNKIDSFITTIKSKFGVSNGSLGGKPNEINEISSFTTSVQSGSGQFVSINNISNPKITHSITPSENSINIRFFSSSNTHEEFTFDYTYSEAGYESTNTYSAICYQRSESSFFYTPSEINSGQTVTFTDNSSGEPTSWYWEFGDGTTSNAQNPSHTYYYDDYTYPYPNQYYISLKVCNGYDCDTYYEASPIIVYPE